MKMLLLLTISVLLGMCSNQAPNAENGAAPSQDAMEMSNASPAKPSVQNELKKNASKNAQVSQKLILTADISMEVKDYNVSRKKLRRILNQFGAQVFQEAEQRLGYRTENKMVIRVGPTLFDSLIITIEQLSSEIDTKNVNTQNVTQQYVDIESRLVSKRAVIEQYRQLMKTANNISEILNINEKMNAVIEEVESAEAQLRTLRDQVQLSTLNLTIYQNLDNITARHDGFGSRLGDAFSNGWQGLLNVFVGIIYVWPLLLTMGITLFFILRANRKRIKVKVDK